MSINQELKTIDDQMRFRPLTSKSSDITLFAASDG